MPENTNTYGELERALLGYANGGLLTRAQPRMVTDRFGKMDPQPLNASRTRTYARYESLAPSPLPITEGVPPKGQKVTRMEYTATLEELADIIPFTDRIKNVKDPVLAEMVNLAAEQMATSIELFRLAKLKAGTSVFYAGGVTSRALVNSQPLKSDLKKIVRALKRNLGKPISSQGTASVKYGTENVPEAYVMLINTDQADDFRDLANFIQVQKYSDPSIAVDGEIGSVAGLRIVETTLLTPWLAAGASGTTFLSSGDAVTSATACDVYPALILADKAFYITPLKGEPTSMERGKGLPARVKIHQPTVSDSDPLGQKGHVGWLTDQALCRTNELWIVRYESGCRANPSE